MPRVLRTQPARACCPKGCASRWKVYPQFIPDGDQIICKTYMTRVEGENTRLRHYLGGAYAPDQAELGTGRIRVRITPKNSLLLKVDRDARILD